MDDFHFVMEVFLVGFDGSYPIEKRTLIKKFAYNDYQIRNLNSL